MLLIGGDALKANTTAANNTAVGKAALQANTTGASNTAVGYNALDANTTGGANVALGYGALSANTTASNNTADWSCKCYGMQTPQGIVKRSSWAEVLWLLARQLTVAL